jgi:hypothetical protein
MIPKLVTDLNEIAAKPGATPSTLLIVTRRTCRILVGVRAEIWQERKVLRREAEKLRKNLPYSVLDMEVLEDRADTHRADEHEYIRARLAQFGHLMSADGSGVAASLGFERLCDILNVNPVHRPEARIEGGKTLRGLIFEARVEDSADVKSEHWASGGPLCEAFYAAYCDDVMQNSRQELANQPATIGELQERANLDRRASVFAAASVMIH